MFNAVSHIAHDSAQLVLVTLLHPVLQLHLMQLQR